MAETKLYSSKFVKMSKYRLLRDSIHEPKAKTGTVVYSIKWSDAGLASADTRLTGIRHRTVTLNEDGDYPGFTVPEDDIELIE